VPLQRGGEVGLDGSFGLVRIARLAGGCEHGLVYDGHLEAPKGKTLDDWEPVELPLFRSTRFGDDQDRPIPRGQ
jgi:hypothetical protein